MKRQEQKGFVLFVVMIFLIVMSLLGISMFKGFINDQKNSGNVREKQRAIEAAQASLDNIQNWMQTEDKIYQGGFRTGIFCDTTTQVGTEPVVCSNALASPANLSWSSSQTFTASTTTLPVNASGGQNNYASNPNYYIQYLGTSSQNVAMYKVTSKAQGGNATAATVLETIFEVKFTSRDIGGS